jgi:hypothetical protein
MKRYSKKQADLAAKISNDISEGIDCGEGRKSLRMAVAYWADQYSQEVIRRVGAEDELLILKLKFALLTAQSTSEDVQAKALKTIAAEIEPWLKNPLGKKGNKHDPKTRTKR